MTSLVAALAVAASAAPPTPAAGAAPLSVVSPTVVLAALALGALTTVAGAARWCVVARGVGLVLPLGRATAQVYRATFLNAVLPAGVLGDVHRAAAQGGARGARAVVVERVAGQVVTVAGCAAVVLVAPGSLGSLVGGPPPTVAVVTATAVLVGLLALVPGAGASRVGRLRGALTRSLVALGRDVRTGVLARRTGPAVVLLSLLALGGHLTLFALAARVAGVTAALPRLLPLLVVALLAMALPLSVCGWGPREAVSAVAFSAAGLGAGPGLATAAVYGVLALVSTLPGAAVLAAQLVAARRRAHRATDLDGLVI